MVHPRNFLKRNISVHTVLQPLDVWKIVVGHRLKKTLRFQPYLEKTNSLNPRLYFLVTPAPSFVKVQRSVHCPKINLSLGIKSEPVTAGVHSRCFEHYIHTVCGMLSTKQSWATSLRIRASLTRQSILANFKLNTHGIGGGGWGGGFLSDICES